MRRYWIAVLAAALTIACGHDHPDQEGACTIECPDGARPDPVSCTCPDDGPEETIEAIVAEITSQRCVPCHLAPDPSRGIEVATVEGLSAIIGQPAGGNDDLLLIAPGDPDNSYLMAKLVAEDDRRVGERMPRNGPPYLSAQEIERIRAWIEGLE